jgi:hypothetical protein
MALYPLLKKGLSGGRGKKLAVVVASVSDGDTITTGLASIDGAAVCCQASTVLAAGTDSAFLAEMRSASGGVITINLIAFQSTGPVIEAYATDVNVCAVAVGS